MCEWLSGILTSIIGPSKKRLLKKSLNRWNIHFFNLLLDFFQWLFQRRRLHPTPVLLPGKSHGWRSLVGCSPWGREESDTTKRLHFHFSLSCIGEGNGNPLQCSCLENPRDSGAWWAASYGVAQSRTQLKWLSSSSSSHKKEQNFSLSSWRHAAAAAVVLLQSCLTLCDPIDRSPPGSCINSFNPYCNPTKMSL